MEHLFKHRADVNGKDGNGRTVLQISEDRKHDDIEKILIENGADPFSLDISSFLNTGSHR